MTINYLFRSFEKNGFFLFFSLTLFCATNCISFPKKDSTNNKPDDSTKIIKTFPIIEEEVERPVIDDGDVVIAENKKSIPIILPSDATPYMKDAAQDLAIYINKISKAKPEVLIGEPNPRPKSAIWVGYQESLRTVFPEIDFNFKFPEEIILAAQNNHILIAGRDVWNPDAMEIPDRTGKKMVTGIQQEYGTCNAVYTFLQDKLGVRWLWADEEDVPENNSIVIKPFNYRYHPVIRDRSGILQLTKITNNKGKEPEKDWAIRQRMALSSTQLDARHAFGDWWEKYGASHPEYFAMQDNGKREPKGNPQNIKLCQNRPGVWDTWMKEVSDQLKENPNQNIFSAASNDGWSQGQCTGAECAEWDIEPGGLKAKPPILSDREVRFANTLGKKLKEKYPGKDYKVLIMGYGYTRPAPLNTIPDDNVILLDVGNFHMRGDGFEDTRTLAMQQYADWAKVAKHIAFRPNLGSPAGLKQGMPDVAPHQAAIDFAFLAKNGCEGLYFDSHWNHWSTQGIQYYTTAQLAWNPFLNVDSLLDDFYFRAYGPAANEMKSFWNLMEDTRNALIEKVKGSARFLRIYEIYTPAFFMNAANMLAKAKAKITNADLKYKRRFDFAGFGLEYAQLVVNTRTHMAEWEKNVNNNEARKAVLDDWQNAKNLKARSPKFAINFQMVFNNPKGSMMRGMHPDNPQNAKTLRRIQNTPGFE